jgi:two-component system phosphate regulon response regulator PhoB
VAKASILIVEDEPDIAELIRFNLAREGFDAGVIASGRMALDVARKRPPELLILDLMLPEMDGLEICRRLKWAEETRRIPILIVSAKGEESDIVTGLELGADDYITKPFSPRVLVARVRSILRRAGEENRTTSEPKAISVADGRLIIDPDRHAVTVDHEPIELTKTEFDILHTLAQRRGFVRTRDQIIAAIHGEDTVQASRTIDVHVTALRRKLGGLGASVETVRGVGYRLADPPARIEA